MARVSKAAVLLVIGACLQMAAAYGTELHGTASPHNPLLPVPRGLVPQVEFWKKIFATYSTRQVVIHDTLYLDRIYEVLDFQDMADGGADDNEIAAYAQERARSEKERIRAILIRLHQLGPDPRTLSAEERRIWALFADVNTPSKFLQAADEDRIRSQAGLRERFATGVQVSRRYLPEMEAIFRRAGLPIELTRLPLVESSFNVRAYSKAGAAGIWQFMPSTARSYMRVNRHVDERRDPIISTRAAAAYLRESYDLLGTWPLAITAYNHGQAGVANAVATVGSSDLMRIIREYDGPAFKFASRNFYAEFIAALEIEQNFSKYFGDLYPVRPPSTDRIIVPASLSLRTLARASNADVETLVELNPALAREVVVGRQRVPKGYELRVPEGTAARFDLRVVSVSSDEGRRVRKSRYRVQKAQHVTHHVKRGQTLATIAKRYGTSVSAIRRHNKLRASGVRIGQRLTIPTT